MKRFMVCVVFVLVAMLAVAPAFGKTTTVTTKANAGFGVSTAGFAGGIGGANVGTSSGVIGSSPGKTVAYGQANASAGGIGFAGSCGYGCSSVVLTSGTQTSVGISQ
jgi:pectate lyase